MLVIWGLHKSPFQGTAGHQHLQDVSCKPGRVAGPSNVWHRTDRAQLMVARHSARTVLPPVGAAATINSLQATHDHNSLYPSLGFNLNLGLHCQ